MDLRKTGLKTLERGQENCYLMTNGLGGFSSLTLTGSAARNDHAFLMACTQAPNNRYNIIHRLSEMLEMKSDGDIRDYRLLPRNLQTELRRRGTGI